MAKAKETKGYKNRIVGEGVENPEQLLANPNNWRIHPIYQQEALQKILNKIGWVDQVIVNRTTGHLVDGHLRVQTAMRNNETEIPVLYVELNLEEESIILASLDPLTAMAKTDEEMLKGLIEQVRITDEETASVLDNIAIDSNMLKGVLTNPTDEWQDMPEFTEQSNRYYRSLIIHFNTQQDVDNFIQLTDLNITPETKYKVFPETPREVKRDQVYEDEPDIN